MRRYLLATLVTIFVFSFAGQCLAGGHHRHPGRHGRGNFGRDFGRAFERNLERNLELAATVAITELTVMAVDGIDRAIRGTSCYNNNRCYYANPRVAPRSNYDEVYWREFLRLQEQELYKQQALERQQAASDARRYFYGK